LPGVPVAAGTASGRLHLVDDPLNWGSASPNLGEVLGLPSLWWPPSERLPESVTGVLLHGLPREKGEPPGVPVLADIDADLLREGEVVYLDGDSGMFWIDGTTEVGVVTAFLERPDGRILLLQRSANVGSFQGRWAGVSGYLEDSTPVRQAIREVREETGLRVSEDDLATGGVPLLARDASTVFVVHPLLFHVKEVDEVRLDWEHTHAEWVDPHEIRRRPTVPKLDRAWEAVAPAARVFRPKS
jgi:8-oxo-dGTP diphosphatase